MIQILTGDEMWVNKYHSVCGLTVAKVDRKLTLFQNNVNLVKYNSNVLFLQFLIVTDSFL